MLRVPPNHWNKKNCAQKALEYTSRKNFSDHARGAYKAACKNGWMDDSIGEKWFTDVFLQATTAYTRWIFITRNFGYSDASNGRKHSHPGASSLHNQLFAAFIPVCIWASKQGIQC